MDVSLKHTAMAFVLKRNDRRKGHKLLTQGSRVRARQFSRHCQSVCLPPFLHSSISPPPVLRLSLLLPAAFLSSFLLISFHLEQLFPLNAFLLSLIQVRLSFLASYTSGHMIQASAGRETHLYRHWVAETRYKPRLEQ